MALTCDLSPVVFAELYQLLAKERAWRHLLTDRLAEIGLAYDWLSEAAGRYEARWQYDLQSNVYPNDVYTVRDRHAVLASWLMAPLRALPSSADDAASIAISLPGRVLQRVLAAVPAAESATLPPALRPNICAWVLGSVHGTVDAELPMALPLSLREEHVAMGYAGLLEHCAALDQNAQPWPEMIATSTVWRGFGLAEAMRPDQDGQQKAVSALLAEVNRFVTSPVHSQMRSHWAGTEHLRITRNVLTHVLRTNKDEKGNGDKIEIKFTETVAATRRWQDIRPTIFGVTVFVANRLAATLADLSPGVDGCPVAKGTWDELAEWDLYVP